MVRDLNPGEGIISLFVLDWHHASYSVGTGRFKGVKRPQCGFDPSLPSSIDDKERVELTYVSAF